MLIVQASLIVIIHWLLIDDWSMFIEWASGNRLSDYYTWDLEVFNGIQTIAYIF